MRKAGTGVLRGSQVLIQHWQSWTTYIHRTGGPFGVFLYYLANYYFMLSIFKSTKVSQLERRVNSLESELIQARKKNASYRGKIGSLGRQLKEAKNA